MVMHWKTVSMAKKKLSKLVMPPLGPSQRPRHSVLFCRQARPWPEKAHGEGSSSDSRSGRRKDPRKGGMPLKWGSGALKWGL